MPLIESAVQNSLRAIDRVMPHSAFTVWAKKCWLHLDCAKTKMKTDSNPARGAATGPQHGKGKDEKEGRKEGGRRSPKARKSQKQITHAQPKQHPYDEYDRYGVSTFEDFEDYYMFPHEFFSLVINSYPRSDALKEAYGEYNSHNFGNGLRRKDFCS